MRLIAKRIPLLVKPSLPPLGGLWLALHPPGTTFPCLPQEFSPLSSPWILCGRYIILLLPIVGDLSNKANKMSIRKPTLEESFVR